MGEEDPDAYWQRINEEFDPEEWGSDGTDEDDE